MESSLSDKPVDDPFRLRAALRDPDDVATLRRRWNPRKQRRIGKFYETQNEKIDAMLKVCFRGSELLLYDKFSPCVDHGEPRSGGGRGHEGKRLESMFFFTQHGSTERTWLMIWAIAGQNRRIRFVHRELHIVCSAALRCYIISISIFLR